MTYLRPSLVLLILLTLIVGLLYPLLSTGLAQLLFADRANGSLLYQHDTPVGSALIGQHFTRQNYFWGRPSVTEGTPYNALASGGSNLAISNPALDKEIKQRVIQLQQAHGKAQPIPVDLLTASSSGLDPHISLAAAYYQAERIAAIRHLSVPQVNQLIDQHTEQPVPGFMGEPVVNVLTLNLALDNATPTTAQ